MSEREPWAEPEIARVVFDLLDAMTGEPDRLDERTCAWAEQLIRLVGPVQSVRAVAAIGAGIVLGTGDILGVDASTLLDDFRKVMLEQPLA